MADQPKNTAAPLNLVDIEFLRDGVEWRQHDKPDTALYSKKGETHKVKSIVANTFFYHKWAKPLKGEIPDVDPTYDLDLEPKGPGKGGLSPDVSALVGIVKELLARFPLPTPTEKPSKA